MAPLQRIWSCIAHSRLFPQQFASSMRRLQLEVLPPHMASCPSRSGKNARAFCGRAAGTPSLPFALASSLLLCNHAQSTDKSASAKAFDSCRCICHSVAPFSRRRRCQQSAQQTRKYSNFHDSDKGMDTPVGLFRGDLDRFNGITIKSEVEYDENVNFALKLQKSLDYWIGTNRRCIWFYVRTEHSAWIPHLVQAGFDFHHAKKGFAVLYRWLPQEYDNIPDFCHTMIGVGGLVVNEKQEVLVVGDRFALIPKSWKLPGGFVEPAEHLVNAAIREVREETGINSTFNTVISIRHSHKGSFGCSDMYVVVALTPTNLELKPCDREIERIKWMPIAEYLQHPHVHETNRHFLRTFLDYKRRGIKITVERAEHQILKKEYALYYVKPVEEATTEGAETKS